MPWMDLLYPDDVVDDGITINRIDSMEHMKDEDSLRFSWENKRVFRRIKELW